MKSTRLLWLVLTATLTYSCLYVHTPDNPAPSPQELLCETSEIGLNSVVLKATNKFYLYDRYRFFFQLSENPDMLDVREYDADHSSAPKVTINKLSQGTEYWYRFCISDGISTVTGPVGSFKTLEAPFYINLGSITGISQDTVRVFAYDENGGITSSWMLAQKNMNTGKWSLPSSHIQGRYLTAVTAIRVEEVKGGIVHFNDASSKIYWGKSQFLTKDNPNASIQMKALSFLVNTKIYNYSSTTLKIRRVYFEDTSFSSTDGIIHFDTYLDTFSGDMTLSPTSSVYWNHDDSPYEVNTNGDYWSAYRSFYKDTNFSSGRLRIRLVLENGTEINLPIPASSWHMGTDYEVSFKIYDSTLSSSSQASSAEVSIIPTPSRMDLSESKISMVEKANYAQN